MGVSGKYGRTGGEKHGTPWVLIVSLKTLYLKVLLFLPPQLAVFNPPPTRHDVSKEMHRYGGNLNVCIVLICID